MSFSSWRRVRGLLPCLAVFTAIAAQAQVGLRELPGLSGDGPVTIFYPSDALAQPTVRGSFTLQVAPDAAPVRGNGRLVVLSHGSGGSPWIYSDFAIRLVRAGFVVALPEHKGDNWHDHHMIGPPSWKRRPHEVSRAIDVVGADPQLAPQLRLDRVGMWGMSAGGHTALALAGGRWSPSALRAHCEAHIDDDFTACVGLTLELKGNWADGMKKSVARFFIGFLLDDTQWYGHTDPRIAAIVAEVPFAADFDMASLARPVVPLGLVRNGQDAWLKPAYHVDPVRQACTSCTLVLDLPTAGHGSLISPQVPDLSGQVARLLADPPGFDRAQVPLAHERIIHYMTQHLLP
ncbi:alpha/beta hydrolase family protein [Hylemonella sp. W303a]|uniref:alpha/beta hydrolase family protein n=1 Tax=Hylemonella sp. W303a TaxID=3389873 RepID=UPI00396AF9FE